MNTPPKEKAEEIFKLMIKHQIWNAGDSYEKVSEGIKYRAKQCALIYCDGMQAERKRAIKIAYDFRKKRLDQFELKRASGFDLAFIQEDIAEECRHIGNAISGHNALSVTLKEKDYWMQVKDEIEKL
jgi:hypothetical protein